MEHNFQFAAHGWVDNVSHPSTIQSNQLRVPSYICWHGVSTLHISQKRRYDERFQDPMLYSNPSFWLSLSPRLRFSLYTIDLAG